MSSVNFYKIICAETKRVYVGSTVLTIQKRLNQHERNYRKFLNGRYNFVSSYIVLEKKNYTVELIDTIECNDRKHRDLVEGLHIINERAVNRIIPGGERKVYREGVPRLYDVHVQGERTECPCGGRYIRQHRNKHFNTKKHKKYLEEQERNEKRGE